MTLLTAVAEPTVFYVYLSIFRVVAPIIVCVLLFRCIKPLLTFRREPEIWAWLEFEDETEIPITHWENVIGSSKRSANIDQIPYCQRGDNLSSNKCLIINNTAATIETVNV